MRGNAGVWVFFLLLAIGLWYAIQKPEHLVRVQQEISSIDTYEATRTLIKDDTRAIFAKEITSYLKRPHAIKDILQKRDTTM